MWATPTGEWTREGSGGSGVAVPYHAANAANLDLIQVQQSVLYLELTENL